MSHRSGNISIKGYDVYYYISDSYKYPSYSVNNKRFSSLIQVQCYLELFYNEGYNFSLEKYKIYTQNVVDSLPKYIL